MKIRRKVSLSEAEITHNCSSNIVCMVTIKLGGKWQIPVFFPDNGRMQKVTLPTPYSLNAV